MSSSTHPDIKTAIDRALMVEAAKIKAMFDAQSLTITGRPHIIISQGATTMSNTQTPAAKVNKLSRAYADTLVGQPCPGGCNGTLLLRPAASGYGKELVCTNHPACGVLVGVKSSPRGKPFGSDQPSAEDVEAQTQVIAHKAAAASGTFVFPFDEYHDMATAIRQSLASGATGLTCGPRKGEMWIEAAVRLHDSGLATHKDALALAYHLAVVAREIEANRKFAIEMWQNKFGHTHDVSVPVLPFQQVVAFMLENNLPLYVTGLPGVGKTYTIIDEARRVRREVVRQQNGGESTMSHVLGDMGIEAGKTSWQDGTLTHAARTGRIFLSDEMDKARDDVQSAYVALLESHDGTITLPTGERIIPAPGFGFAATGNTVGLGEGLQFEGTRVINEAIRDRLYFLSADYPTKAVERSWNEARLAKLGLTATL